MQQTHYPLRLFGFNFQGNSNDTPVYSADPLSPIPFAGYVNEKEEDPFAPTPLAPWYKHSPADHTVAKKNLAREPVPVSSKEQAEPLKKPKRPLTAYNLYFHSERLRLIEARSTKNNKGKVVKGKVAFAEMARIISKRWNQADSSIRAPFCHKANVEKLRYLREKQEYNDQVERRRQSEEQERAAEAAAVSVQAFSPRNDPYIAELALKLDQESTDYIVRIFGWTNNFLCFHSLGG